MPFDGDVEEWRKGRRFYAVTLALEEFLFAWTPLRFERARALFIYVVWACATPPALNMPLFIVLAPFWAFLCYEFQLVCETYSCANSP